MNFIDSIRAVLEGRPEEADAEQRPIAEDAIAVIREGDEGIRRARQQIASERNAGRIVGYNEARLESCKTAISLERARCVAITEACVKASISVRQTIQFIQSGVDPKEVVSYAAGVIMQQPVTAGNVQAKGDDRLLAAVAALKQTGLGR